MVVLPVPLLADDKAPMLTVGRRVRFDLVLKLSMDQFSGTVPELPSALDPTR